MNRRALLLLSLVGAPVLAADAPALPVRFDPARDALADLHEAQRLAREQGKRLVLDVGGNWCVWCHVLDRAIARDDPLRTLLRERYVWLKVNVSPQNRNERLLSRWPKVVGYPHLFVLDADGALVLSQDCTPLQSGNDYDRAKLLALFSRYAA